MVEVGHHAFGRGDSVFDERAPLTHWNDNVHLGKMGSNFHVSPCGYLSGKLEVGSWISEGRWKMLENLKILDGDVIDSIITHKI